MFCPRCHAEYPESWKVCPTDETSLLASAKIGKYAIDGVLGVGGMGAVYRATNPDTGAAVAVKVMNAEVASSADARERFKREAGVVSRLDTAHVCKVFDFGSDSDGTMFLVMELMKGHTLGVEIQPPPGYMDLARVQMVMDGALKGLAAAHQNGVVHRDLKPDNVFVADTFDGEIPKLLDFGIARVTTPGNANLTRTGTIMGTASYMAPEQVAGTVDLIGPWTDVYAMGAILYEMLAGAPAFGDGTISEVLHRVIRGVVVPLGSVRTGLPEDVYELVADCLALEPTTRPRDADAMRTALLAARLVPPGSPVPAPSLTRTQGQAGSARGRDVAVATAQLGPSAPSANPGGAAMPTATLGAPAARTDRDAVASTPVTGELGAPVATPVTADLGKVSATPGKRRVTSFVLAGVVALVLGGGALAFALRGGGSHASDEPAPPASRSLAVVVPDAAPRVATTPPAPVPAKQTRPGMVEIPGGSYTIGQSRIDVEDGLSPTPVTLAGYWIDTSEVTLAQLEATLGEEVDPNTRAKTKGSAPTSPARFVDFEQAEEACNAMGKRLPTESEWEVAALTTPQDPQRARLRVTGKPKDLDAMGTDCSPAGLCDMLGSVSELTSTDWPDEKEPSKVARGGSFQTPPADIRQATIHARAPVEIESLYATVGFRCVVSEPDGAGKGSSVLPK